MAKSRKPAPAKKPARRASKPRPKKPHFPEPQYLDCQDLLLQLTLLYNGPLGKLVLMY